MFTIVFAYVEAVSKLNDKVLQYQTAWVKLLMYNTFFPKQIWKILLVNSVTVLHVFS